MIEKFIRTKKWRKILENLKKINIFIEIKNIYNRIIYNKISKQRLH